LDEALRIAMEHGLRYSALPDFDVDVRLWRYLPLALALRERVIPMIVIGDTLSIASVRPDPDLTDLHRHFPNLRTEIVLAPASAVDAVLTRAVERSS
jgi:hypothetical protein